MALTQTTYTVVEGKAWIFINIIKPHFSNIYYQFSVKIIVFNIFIISCKSMKLC